MPPKAKKPEPFGAQFNRLRMRAADTSTKKPPKVDDFVLGPDEGFDPPVVATFPLSMKDQEAYYYASREGNPFAQMRIVLGDAQYERVRDMFDQVPDGQDLMVGLSAMLLDHMQGKGADDVPGGSSRS